jgi:hypothetical protein
VLLARRVRPADCCAGEVEDEDLCRLYTAFRVASLLLLRFQTDRADDYTGPSVTIEGYRLFHEALGFRVPEVVSFHPFFHEITGVEQAASAGAPVTVLRQAWPALMLGRMMFCRAGCVVAGGTAHVVKEIAEHSKLFWTFRRNDRPCEDQSHGWGSNSQWATALRRDYASPAGFRYNIDGKESLDGASGTLREIDAGMMREVVRNRCLVRTAADDSDFYPYRYTLAEAPEVFPLDPTWLTATVVTLARNMYESGDFSAMPILADALQDAGCDSDEVLDHCRAAAPHVRGCWVVDLVLGKE